MADEAGTTAIAPQVTGPVAPEKEQDQSNDLLAGKFKSTEDLVNAYKALESKLGQKGGDATDREGQGETQLDQRQETSPFIVESKSEADIAFEKETYGEALANVFQATGLSARAVSEHFHSTGKFPEEAYVALEGQGFARNVVDAYLAGQQQKATQKGEIAQAEVAEIKKSIGGEAEFTKMVTWAANNLTPEEQESFNAVVTMGDKAAAMWAVQGLYAKFTAKMGREPDLVGGRPASDSGVGKFNSTAELTAAMKDPRYAKDPAYRDAVTRKLANSNLFRH